MTLDQLKNTKDEDQISYNDLLQCSEWKSKREKVLLRDNYECSKCGSNAKHSNFRMSFEVHHKYYILNRFPWEYIDAALITLCRECHQEIHDNEKIPFWNSEMLVEDQIENCLRCLGKGYLPEYNHIQSGICFKCGGTGGVLPFELLRETITNSEIDMKIHQLYVLTRSKRHISKSLIGKRFSASEQTSFSYIEKLITFRKDFFIKMISKFYPFTDNLLAKYESYFDWKEIIDNKSIEWYPSRIERFDEKFSSIHDWNPESVVWSEELFTKYKYKFNTYRLTYVRNLPWSLSFFEENRDILSFEGMSLNIPWDDKEFEIYFKNLDWSLLSLRKDLPWSIDFIRKYRNNWNWKLLSRNNRLPWSSQLLEEFISEWDWSGISFGNHGNQICTFVWTEEIIDKYYKLWDWEKLSSNMDFPISEKLIDKYYENWNWASLSLRPELPWSEKLIEKYIDKWDWHRLSMNSGFPWTESLQKKYSKNFCYRCLSDNTGFPWTETFIDLNKEKLSWGSLRLSHNESLPWSDDFIEKYEDRWKWDFGFAENEGINWSPELLVKFGSRFDWECLYASKNIFEINFKNMDEYQIEELIKFHKNFYNSNDLLG